LNPSNDRVLLRGGLAVSASALQTLWNLEDRGIKVELSPNGGLLIGPRDSLTAQDRDRIRNDRDDIARLVAYCERLDKKENVQ
jgi:hypothetical protein